MRVSAPSAPYFWSLPGPGEFARQLQSDLERFGWTQQVVIAVPGQGGPPAVTDLLLSMRTPRRVAAVQVGAADEDCVAAMCLRQAGLQLPQHIPAVPDLVNGCLADHLLVIDATMAAPPQLQDVEQIVLATAAAAYNAAQGDLPLQVVVVLPGHALSHAIDGPRLITRWWWGRLSALDTQVLLRLHDGAVSETTTAAIVEIATYDLDLALHLLQFWDGEAETLVAQLKSSTNAHRSEATAPPIAHRPLPDRPGSTLINAWTMGACDLWGSRSLVWHAQTLAEHDPSRLTHALWRAQAATVLPLLDEQRMRVHAWLNRQGHAQQLREHYGAAPEIGDLWYYMRRRAGMAARPQMSLVDWLRDARNDVAHLRRVSNARLNEGLDLIASIAL